MWNRLCFLILAIFSLSFAHAWEFVDKAGDTIQIEMCKEEDLKGCEEVFVNAFLEAYSDFSEQLLGVKDKRAFLKEAFADVYDDLKKGEQKLLVAKKDGKVIAMSGFKEENPHQIYITQLAVDPAYWRNGIGSKLVFLSLSLYDNVESLVVIHRKVNVVAKDFYNKLGFSPSEYMHPGYSPEKYSGFEWKKS